MTPAAPAPDFLVLGHLSLDQTPTGPTLGGTAAYAALTARALARRPAIVTAAGPDLDLSPLAGIPVHRSASPQSTTFLNEYSSSGRRQRLLARAASLGPESIPVAWRSASIVHVAPIAGEVPPLLVDLFPESDLIGLTPQGWMRTWDDDGRVSYTSWTPAVAAVRRADVVILGVEDVGGNEEELAYLASVCRLLVVTEGPRGARVYWNGDVRRFAPPATEQVDPTGAGDVFAASFFVRFQHTRDPWEAARFANRLAATSVTRRGLHGVPTPEEAQDAAMVWTR